MRTTSMAVRERQAERGAFTPVNTMSELDTSLLAAIKGIEPDTWAEHSPPDLEMIEPGTRWTWAEYLERLDEAARGDFKWVESLARSLDIARTSLTLAERRTIVEQAIHLFDEHYSHLPQKKSMYAHDPVQRLRLLRLKLDRSPKVEPADEMRFHQEMLSIFASVRDLHTLYLLPKPYHLRVAFLPFTIGEFFKRDDLSGRKPRYMVTGLMNSLEIPGFEKAEILYWNGVPVARAVEILADRLAGGNSAARRVRGLARLTFRPLALSLAPDEEWVDVCYLDANTGHRVEIRVYWHVYTDPVLKAANKVLTREGMGKSGLDLESDFINETRKKLFPPEMRPSQGRLFSHSYSTLPGQGEQLRVLEFEEIRTYLDQDIVQAFRVKDDDHEVALIKIHTFAIEDESVESFVRDFVSTLDDDREGRTLPWRGLILDVRGNAGGRIPAAERLLQLFTPRTIQPQRFQFVNSTWNLELCKRVENEFGQWAKSIRGSVATGATHSRGLEISGVKECNATGQRYFSPVVLLVDATCYSATDMFIAGFFDHEIGDIIGVHENTGAGGASIVTHSKLEEILGGNQPASPPDDRRSPYVPLPEGTEMQIALRRSLRVGDNAGTPVEDLGVPLAADVDVLGPENLGNPLPESPGGSPPEDEGGNRHQVRRRIYRLTQHDLLNGDVGLYATALDLLREKTTRDFISFKLEEDNEDSDDPIRLVVKARNIRGCQAFADVAELTQEKVSARIKPKDGSGGFTRTFYFSFRGRIFGRLASNDDRNLSKRDLKRHKEKTLKFVGWHSEDNWKTKTEVAVKRLTIKEFLELQKQ